MKILFIGDPHLKITRFDLARQFLEWINTVINDYHPDAVVNLGDTFDTHAVVRSEIQGEFKKHVQFTTDLGIRYFYILGNHDFYTPKSSKYHALQSMEDLPKFHVISKRTDFPGITMVPHLPDHTLFPKDVNPICIAHQTFVGADYGYMRPEVGVDAGAVNAEIIISGHIHVKQEFGKVIYPGTPYAQSVNDIDQHKGVLLFDTDTYAKEFIESPLPRWQGMRAEINQTFTIEDLHNDLFQYLDSKNHWVVEITGPKAEILAYLGSKQFKEVTKGVDIKVKTKFTDKKKQQIQIEALSMEHIVDEYMNKVYKGSLDKKKISSKALEILNKVRQGQAKAHL